MIMSSIGRFVATRSFAAGAVLALCTGSALLAGCSQEISGSATPAAPVVAPVTTETPQERNLRIHDELVRLGCDTSSCIQTYFACEDGLPSGEVCEFQRRHPLK